MSITRNWKTWIAWITFALVMAYALRQYQFTFGSHPPASLQLREHQSRSIPHLRQPTSAWRQFRSLLQTVRATAETQHADEYTILLIEFQHSNPESVQWWGETVRNQGFEPLTKIERELWTDPSRLLGYYTADGAPLGFATRLNPPNTGQLLVTVHPDKPIPPGATTFLIRREHRSNLAPVISSGERTIALGRLTQIRGRIDVRGILLPRRATLLRYTPASLATISADPPTMIAWISSDVPTNPTPLSVTFADR